MSRGIMSETDEKLKENANSPKSANIDGQQVEQHSLPDQIAMDKYLKGAKAASRPGSGLKLTKMSHSGS